MITEEQAFKIARNLGLILGEEYGKENNNAYYDIGNCRVYNYQYFSTRGLPLGESLSRLGCSTSVRPKEDRPRTRTSRACDGHGIRHAEANGKSD